MPYKLVKSGEGYYVENKDTGKRYSNKPIPLTNAKKQMKVLYMHSKGELGGEFQISDLKTNEQGTLEICMEGINLTFNDAKVKYYPLI